MKYFPDACVGQWAVRVWQIPQIRQELVKKMPASKVAELDKLVKDTPAPRYACVVVMNYTAAKMDFNLWLASPSGLELPMPPTWGAQTSPQGMGFIVRISPDTYRVHATTLEPAAYSELTGRIEPGTVFVVKSQPFTVQPGTLLVYWIKEAHP